MLKYITEELYLHCSADVAQVEPQVETQFRVCASLLSRKDRSLSVSSSGFGLHVG